MFVNLYEVKKEIDKEATAIVSSIINNQMYHLHKDELFRTIVPVKLVTTIVKARTRRTIEDCVMQPMFPLMSLDEIKELRDGSAIRYPRVGNIDGDKISPTSKGDENKSGDEI